jgi:hypothetical protein
LFAIIFKLVGHISIEIRLNRAELLMIIATWAIVP